MLPRKRPMTDIFFSKSIHGRNLSEKEKKWLLLENDQNIWKAYRDKDGNLLYRFKSCIDNFSYQFKETDPVTGQDVVKAFSVTEKRIVSYNPALARKQKLILYSGHIISVRKYPTKHPVHLAHTRDFYTKK